MKSFPFLEAYLEDLEDMPEEVQMIYLKAVIDYGLKGIVPEFKDYGLKIAFNHARRLIDAGNAQRESASRAGKASAATRGNDAERPSTEVNGAEQSKSKIKKENIDSKSEIENIREIERQSELLKILSPSTKKISLSDALKQNNSA